MIVYDMCFHLYQLIKSVIALITLVALVRNMISGRKLSADVIIKLLNLEFYRLLKNYGPFKSDI